MTSPYTLCMTVILTTHKIKTHCIAIMDIFPTHIPYMLVIKE